MCKLSSRLPAQLGANRLTRLLVARRAAGLPVLDLTESNPTAVGFRCPETEILAALGRPEILRYRPSPQGDLAARLAIAGYYQDHGRVVDPDSLFLTASTSEAYAYVFKLLADPGQEILVPRPSYPLFDALVGLEALGLVRYPLRYDQRAGWRIDLEQLENMVSTETRAIVAINPNNPTGSFVRPEELAGLNTICQRFGLALIIDEVFLDYGGPAGKSGRGSAVGNEAALTFVLSGLSKVVGLPQLKLGWLQVSGPKALVERAKEGLEFIADTYLSVGGSVQQAAPALLALREDFQGQVRKRLEVNTRYLAEACAGSAKEVLRRDGGWNAVLRLAGDLDEEELVCGLLEETGVLVHPGYFYDFRTEGFVVLSLLPEPTVFRDGVDRLQQRLGSRHGVSSRSFLGRQD